MVFQDSGESWWNRVGIAWPDRGLGPASAPALALEGRAGGDLDWDPTQRRGFPAAEPPSDPGLRKTESSREGFSAPAPASGSADSLSERRLGLGSCRGTARRPGKGVLRPPRTTPALTCARRPGRLWPAAAARCVPPPPLVRSQVRPPRPRPRPRPWPAGTTPLLPAAAGAQMRRWRRSRAAPAPRERRRGRCACRCARGRGPARLRPKPGPGSGCRLGLGVRGAVSNARPHLTPRNPTGRGRVLRGQQRRRGVEGRLEIPGGPPRRSMPRHKVTQRNA